MLHLVLYAWDIIRKKGDFKMAVKTPKKIARVRYVPEDIEAKAIEALGDSEEQRLMAHEKWCEDENAKAEELSKFCHEHRSVVMNRYLALFQFRWGEPPVKPFILSRMCMSGNGKKPKIFDSITKFLKEERESNGGDNKMYDLYTDYFNIVFDYYLQYNRRPTINQISAGPTNQEQFKVWAYHEHHGKGGYWITKDQIERSESMAKSGSGFKDIFIDKMRIENGLEPIFGTTQEDIDNWDGKTI
jgi:hypothetical protein